MIFRVCFKIGNALDTFQDRTYPGRCAGSDTTGNFQFYRFWSCKHQLRSCYNKYSGKQKYEYAFLLLHDKCSP